MSVSSAYAPSQVLDKLFSTDTKYCYWQIFAAGGGKLAEYVEPVEHYTDAAQTSRTRKVAKDTDVTESERLLRSELEMLPAGRFVIEAWANASGKKGALRIPFASDAVATGYAASSVLPIGTSDSGMNAQLLQRMDELQARLDAREEADRLAELRQLKDRIKELENSQGTVNSYLEPIGRVVAETIMQRFMPSGLLGAQPSAQPSAETGTIGAPASGQELSDEEAEQVGIVAESIILKHGDQGIEAMKALQHMSPQELAMLRSMVGTHYNTATA